MNDRGPWIQTFTNKQFYPLDPIIGDISIADIAHALSLKCRFGGHCAGFYSVAEHSWLVSQQVPTLEALLHDAAEAYSPFGDVPRPLKPHLRDVERVEKLLDVAIRERFGLLPSSNDVWTSVKTADNRILMDEKAALFDGGPEWDVKFEPLGIKIRMWPAYYAEEMFLRRYRELGGG